MRSRNLLLTAAVGLVLACSKPATPVQPPAPNTAAKPSAPSASLPSGSLTSRVVAFDFDIYGLDPKAPVRAAAFEALVRKSDGIERVSELPKAPPDHPIVVVSQVDPREQPPPDLESLRYFGRGLSPSQTDQLAQSSSLVTLTFAAPQSQALTTLRFARELALRAATATHGAIWDEESRLAFSPQRWKADRIDTWTDRFPPVIDSIALHAYQDSSEAPPGIRLVTLGMAKFGLPDLAIDDIPSSFGVRGSLLIQLVAQTLLEHPALEQPGALTVRLDSVRNPHLAKAIAEAVGTGAARHAVVRLVRSPPQPGDADNPLLAIVFPGNGPLAERQYAFLSQLFGSAEKAVNQARPGDQELLVASARARARLPSVKRRFVSEKEHLDRLIVKKGFWTPEGTEYMWIEVHSWRGNRLGGVLINEPEFVKTLHEGAPVSLDESEVYDYAYGLADGGSEGGETDKILEERRSHGALP